MSVGNTLVRRPERDLHVGKLVTTKNVAHTEHRIYNTRLHPQGRVAPKGILKMSNPNFLTPKNLPDLVKLSINCNFAQGVACLKTPLTPLKPNRKRVKMHVPLA